MIQAMYSGVSGLKAHRIELDVIGNNIANINTIGFKAGRVTFREMLSQTLRGGGAPSADTGGSNPMQVGLGVGVSAIDMLQSQGSLQATGRPTDLAIEGNGFFVFGDGTGTKYSRDGSLQVDSEGNLVSAASGMRVLGWMVDQATGSIDSTKPITASSYITLPVGKLGIARATSKMTFGGNLDASTPAGTQISGRSGQFFDSHGRTHPINLTFTKTSTPATWTYSFTSADAQNPNVAVAEGTIKFDEKGRPDVKFVTLNIPLADPDGATSPQQIVVSLEPIQMLDGQTTLSPVYQDGLSLGTLETFSVDKSGIITGNLTNGATLLLGRLAIAEFSNPAGLQRAGNNLFIESPNSGLPQIGEPGSGSRGRISAGFLESSNVDLSTEFANMIVAQRGFQANSRIITAADEILQELVQLKR